MDIDTRRTIEKYIAMNINGMHYVRKLKNENKVFSGVIVIDNNRPVENVYRYLKYLYELKGYALNSLTRVSYDLCYFLDFMLVNNLDEENINYGDMVQFIEIYLSLIDNRFNVKRSMLKKISIFN